jgi:hypothetical protein
VSPTRDSKARTRLGVYESKAGQSRHTLASFVVDDVRDTVSQLQGNGVVFEEYDMPGMKAEAEAMPPTDERDAEVLVQLGIGSSAIVPTRSPS